ncbi:MAG TPA: acyl-CoA dehydrogenase family protein [Gaiellaceae bacterium]|nr:acyl-CoA dehydrogenase family protein [Gaiellaceae bacterium]
MEGWTDEQKALRKSLDPYFDKLNEGHIEDDANSVFSREKWDLLRETGLIGLPYDPAYGGQGKDALTMVYVLEHLGHGCRDAGLLFTLATQMVSMVIPIERFGSDELKERYLRQLIEGSLISAHAISEPDAGSDATAMSTMAAEDGDSYVINGKKAFCTSGPVADLITVYATTDPEAGATGISAFVVPTDTPGIDVSDPIPKMGLNTSPIGSIDFTDCRVPKENLIGKPGGSFFMMEHVMTWEILCIFTMMVGEMQRRLEECIKFAKTRKQFGEPIATNQFIQGKIVDQKIGVETCRKHLYDTAEKVSRGKSVVTEIAMAKLVTSEANLASALSAVQIFGGRGYMREAGLEKELRAAVGAPIYSGTNEMQRIRIASMLGLIRPGWKSF